MWKVRKQVSVSRVGKIVLGMTKTATNTTSIQKVEYTEHHKQDPYGVLDKNIMN